MLCSPLVLTTWNATLAIWIHFREADALGLCIWVAVSGRNWRRGSSGQGKLWLVRRPHDEGEGCGLKKVAAITVTRKHGIHQASEESATEDGCLLIGELMWVGAYGEMVMGRKGDEERKSYFLLASALICYWHRVVVGATVGIRDRSSSVEFPSFTDKEIKVNKLQSCGAKLALKYLPSGPRDFLLRQAARNNSQKPF